MATDPTFGGRDDVRAPTQRDVKMTFPLAGRRIVACALLCTFLAACSSWRVVTPTPTEYFQNQRPGEVRVTRTNSSQVTLRAPALLGDTLVGTAGGGLVQGDTARHISVPLRDVRTLEIRKVSVTRTLGLFLGVALVATIICASGDQPAPGC